ncbi:MAG: trypsin-like serine protease [Actinomycetota bacterium]|nr:trypsin-like serine protease [Actinomycetota bacterium]
MNPRPTRRLRRHLGVILAGAALALGVAATGSAQAATAPSGGAAATRTVLSPDALVSSSGSVATPAAARAALSAKGALPQGSQPSPGRTRGFTATALSPDHPLSPDSVIGTDNRFQVTATTSYPSSATVLILRNGRLHCTGWMISKDTMLTAGHCVHTGGSSGSWYSGLTFRPGSNGGTAPFGTYSSRGTWALNGWVNSGSSDYDAAIVKLSSPVGSSTGWFGMWWQSASLDSTFTRVSGYPGDKPSTQWMSYDYVRASQTNRIFYDNDTIGGESGSPVWLYRGSTAPYCAGGPCAMAIHTNGVGSLSATHNSGTRITQAKFSTFMSIVNLP